MSSDPHNTEGCFDPSDTTATGISRDNLARLVIAQGERLEQIEAKQFDEMKSVKGDVHQIKSALFDPPAGGGDPLITRFARAVEFLERGGWAGKWIIRSVLTLAAIGVAAGQIRGWWK